MTIFVVEAPALRKDVEDNLFFQVFKKQHKKLYVTKSIVLNHPPEGLFFHETVSPSET